MSVGISLAPALETFSKYGKTPRQVQLDYFAKLIPQWHKYRVHVANAPVATGKSLIARAIQEQTGAAILTSENTLVDQYAETFSDLNALKGKAKYSCQFGDTCALTCAQLGEFCKDCPYWDARTRASFGEPTVFNPMSYIINVRNGVIDPATVLIIDEAHKLTAFLRSLGTVELHEKDATFRLEDVDNMDKVAAYAHKAIGRLTRLLELKKANTPEDKTIKDDAEMLDKLKLIHFSLTRYPKDFFCHLKETMVRGKAQRSLVVEPLKAPKLFVDVLLKSEKIIMLSGTMFPHHIHDLIGNQPYSYTELEAPIPASQRTIRVRPAADKLNKDTPPEVYARKVKEILERHPTDKGIIHATYGLAEKLKGMLPGCVMSHGKDDKAWAVTAFKDAPAGTYLLASGLAEGIDLSGDLARVNIITKLHFPNLGDPYVLRRKEMPDGELWYLSTTLEHLIQAAGRTTRGVDDHSITYLLDPGIGRVVTRLEALTKHNPDLRRQYLPSYFLEALRW
jgi:ATP-dependent DNA helicase DinG